MGSNKGENGQRLQLWSCNGDEQFKTWSQSGLAAPAPAPFAMRSVPRFDRSPGAAESNRGPRSPGAGGRNPGPRSPASPRSPDERPRLTTTASPQAPSPQVPRGSEFRWAFDRSYCMSVVDNVFQNGQKMQLWGCAGGSGQYFDYSVPHWGMPALLKAAASP